MSRRWRARLGSALVLGATLTLAVGGVAGADPRDIPIEAQVAGTPAGSATGTGQATVPGRSRSASGTGTTLDGSSAVVGPGSAPSASQPAGTESLGGVLAIGGMTTSYTPSGNPLVGTVHVQMTIQNLSSEVIEPSVEFWLTNAFGMRLSGQEDRPIGAIAPGELRVAAADLTGVGQWAVADAHMKLTPPAVVDGVALEPLARDRWLFAPPWFVGVTLALGLAAIAAWRWSARVPATRVAVEMAS